MHRSVRLIPAILLLSSCYAALDEPGPVGAPTTLGADLLDAGETFDVPVDLLAAIAWHETSLSPPHPDHDEHRPATGWTGMTPDRAARAAELTGVSPEDLATDRPANLLGAAAVLGELRDELAPDAGGDHVSGAWWPVVTAWADLGETWMDHDFARDVFRTLRVGLDAESAFGEPVHIEARRIPGLEDVAFVPPPPGEGGRSTIGWPGRARFLTAHSSNYSGRSGGTGAIRRVVLHTTEGSYNGSISWFRDARSNVSAHYVVRKSDGEVTQMVGDDDKAWHACDNNGDTIGIEHEGASANPATWTPAMLDASARLTAWLVAQYGIPIDRDHIVGHGEIQPRHCAGRTDPGPHFPWASYLDLVRDHAGGGSTGDDDDDDGWGPLAFLAPADGEAVLNPVTMRVRHPASHVELWSGPALLASYVADHPATFSQTFSTLGPRSLTARAYRASGSILDTKTITVELVDSLPDPEGSIDALFAVPLGDLRVAFAAEAGGDVARIEYQAGGRVLADEGSGRTWAAGPGFALTHRFLEPGVRWLTARALDEDGQELDRELQSIFVPPVEPACGVDVCVEQLPFSHQATTSGAPSEFDRYSCAPGTDESGPEVVYEVTVGSSGRLTATIEDGWGVDVDVHLLSALDPDACLDRGHTAATDWIGPGTYYVVIDSWVDASGEVFDGAYTLTLTWTGN